MNIVELVATLKSGSRQEIIANLSYLKALFSSCLKKIDDFQTILNTLLECYLTEQDYGMKLEFMNTLTYASFSRDLGSFNYDKIVEVVQNSEDVKIIANCLTILGASYDIKYLPIIVKFQRHKDRSVADEAYDAFREIVISHRFKNDTDVVSGND